jgi:hypothetical protein
VLGKPGSHGVLLGAGARQTRVTLFVTKIMCSANPGHMVCYKDQVLGKLGSHFVLLRLGARQTWVTLCVTKIMCSANPGSIVC